MCLIGHTHFRVCILKEFHVNTNYLRASLFCAGLSAVAFGAFNLVAPLDDESKPTQEANFRALEIGVESNPLYTALDTYMNYSPGSMLVQQFIGQAHATSFVNWLDAVAAMPTALRMHAEGLRMLTVAEEQLAVELAKDTPNQAVIDTLKSQIERARALMNSANQLLKSIRDYLNGLRIGMPIIIVWPDMNFDWDPYGIDYNNPDLAWSWPSGGGSGWSWDFSWPKRDRNSGDEGEDNGVWSDEDPWWDDPDGGASATGITAASEGRAGQHMLTTAVYYTFKDEWIADAEIAAYNANELGLPLGFETVLTPSTTILTQVNPGGTTAVWLLQPDDTWLHAFDVLVDFNSYNGVDGTIGEELADLYGEVGMFNYSVDNNSALWESVPSGGDDAYAAYRLSVNYGGTGNWHFLR